MLTVPDAAASIIRSARTIGRTGRSGRAGRLAVCAGAVVIALLAAGCASPGSAPAPLTSAPASTGSGDLGSLHIRGAYIPQPASPDVAAAYFTVSNDGDVADTLTAVTTPAAPSVSLHTTVDRGGAGTMVPVSQLTLPAHGTATLAVGHDHLMLMQPVHPLTKGQRVTLTLTFAHAGQLRLIVPVVDYAGPDPAGGDMADMPGM